MIPKLRQKQQAPHVVEQGKSTSACVFDKLFDDWKTWVYFFISIEYIQVYIKKDIIWKILLIF